ncbi:metal-dependent hydrolase [Photobacterium japonica]|uniref:metal-dependent hydrolase n=1 Tax=Photobacterium japonica TaxID=2910235 RepID=UPI003D0AFDA9
MPFTPIHMGPALIVKAAAGTAFSLTVFGWSQIVMDIQPLVVILTQEGDLHGISHTLLGALILGLFAAVTGKYLSTWGLILIKWRRYLPIRWKTAFISAYIGTFSHVLLDSIMHVDVSPFAPFSAANPLYGLISISWLHTLCFSTGMLGAVVFVGREMWVQRAHK